MLINLFDRKRHLSEELVYRQTWQVAVEATASIVLILTAFLGNSMLCMVLYKNPGLRSPHAHYMLSLAVSDILMAALCMTSSLEATITGRWTYDNIVCQFQGVACNILWTVSVVTMTLIATNRFFKMVKSPQLYNKLYNSRFIPFSIASSWIAAAIIPLAFLLSGKTFAFHPGKLCCFVEFTTDHGARILVSCMLFICLAITFPPITFCYYKVFQKVRSHSVGVARSAVNSTTARAFIQDVKTTKMLFTTLVAFFFCWLPLFVVDLIELFHGKYTLQREVYVFYTDAVAASSSLNPIIYGLMCRNFRKAYIKLVVSDFKTNTTEVRPVVN